ncbi:methyltransferase domain-containing protein (plasmid) [Rhodobacteraceae bacterium M382]|nr:methyltransferase domain-containing protein [Rhodobacteraceae bacterium M382]
MIEFHGTCPVCASTQGFQSPDEWFRDHLICRGCGSIPRERIFTWALETFRPGWRDMQVHECSPSDRAVSKRLADECAGYIGSQYFPDVDRGTLRDGVRSENLEALTFADQSLDLHVHLDVMEHVNRPDQAIREMCRTLKPGGLAIFTTPIYPDKAGNERRAIYFDDGVEHLAPAEYHGNPIDEDGGALVTFHFGRNFSTLVRAWEPNFAVTHLIPDDPSIGAVGEFRDVFVLRRIG